MQNAVELDHPNCDALLNIFPDFSVLATAGALFLDKEERKPLGFYSAVLKSCERTCTVFGEELFAVKKALNKFMHFMHGKRVKILNKNLSVKHCIRMH